jgi:5-methyltetrahydropteroyltriglutamate--homocysteine methyltransferase
MTRCMHPACLAQAIDGLDADVLTIENSRSGDEMLRELAKYGYSRDIGAGVYDVHSPVVPPCARCTPPCLPPCMRAVVLP